MKVSLLHPITKEVEWFWRFVSTRMSFVKWKVKYTSQERPKNRENWVLFWYKVVVRKVLQVKTTEWKVNSK